LATQERPPQVGTSITSLVQPTRPGHDEAARHAEDAERDELLRMTCGHELAAEGQRALHRAPQDEDEWHKEHARGQDEANYWYRNTTLRRFS